MQVHKLQSLFFQQRTSAGVCTYDLSFLVEGGHIVELAAVVFHENEDVQNPLEAWEKWISHSNQQQPPSNL